MAEEKIRFEDGAGYEKMMGAWSRIAGSVFLDWLAPPKGLRWVDVGCGNGAFSQLLVDRCDPVSVDGFDPSEAQLAFARERPAGTFATFRAGDAMQAPYPDRSFDAAVMALVIFFVPDPARGVAEMARLVKPGGSVSAYAWDILGGGLPHAPLVAALKEIGLPPLYPPSAPAAELSALRQLWSDAGLSAVETHQFTVRRTFDSVDDAWNTCLLGSSIGQRIATLSAAQVAEARELFRANLQQDTSGPITCSARFNAVKGVKGAA